MKNFWSKFNELIFSPIAILVFAGAYYGVYWYFGPEAGLIPPGYFTNVLAGAAVMYIAGTMATLATRLNFPHYFKWVFEREAEAISDNFKLVPYACILLFMPCLSGR